VLETAQFFADPYYTIYYIENPTLAQVQSWAGNMRLESISNLSELYDGTYSPFTPYIMFDLRRVNLSELFINGIDYEFNYLRATDWGSLSFGFNGELTMTRESKQNPDADTYDELEYDRKHKFVLTAGAQIGDFSTTLTYSYLDGYDVLGGGSVDPFRILNLYFSYNFVNAGWLGDNVKLSLSVNNVFEEDPSYADVLGGTGNGMTLGRLITFGMIKKW
jgi:iron complex outermembrane receptor protein